MTKAARKTSAMLAAAILAGATAAAAGAERDPLKQAAAQYEKHYYESAAATLRDGLSATGDPALAQLTLGMIYARNAELQRTLQRSALATEQRYLQKLAARQGRDRSQYAALYYGETLLESGRTDAALAALNGFKGQAGIAPRYRDIAAIKLQVAQARKSGTRPSRSALAIASTDPEVQSELAAALSTGDGKNAESLAIMDRLMADLRRSSAPVPMRVLTNALRVYADAGQPDKAFALLKTQDSGRPSYEEVIGRNKVILRFYDPALLGNLAALDQRAAEIALEKAAAGKYADLAGYLLAESWLHAGQVKPATARVATLATAAGLAPAYRERVAVMQAEIDYRNGKRAAADAAFAGFGRQYAQNPTMLAEVLFACARAGARCAPVTTTAQEAVQAGQGEKFRRLNQALGEQLAAARQAERAIAALETARDKSRKNKIDTNDPLLLVRLADLYLDNKNYSENLEIYFELSKEFPAVRQLQEAGQGIYSMEYRSAGDVKIF